MKKLHLSKCTIDWPKAYRNRAALDSDYSTLITEPTTIYDEGELKIIYDILPKDTISHLTQAVRNIRYDPNWRTNGLGTLSRIFGYYSRNVIKNDFCHATSLAHDFPKEHNLICKFATDLAKLYEKYAPVQFKEHRETTKAKILDNWTIDDTPFTSGIINKNNPLTYHQDRGNIPNMFSNMIGIVSNIRGGNLAIPEYDVGLKISNGSIVIFDGQKIVHGVTPIQRTSPNAYRYTLVYYTLLQMWQCLTPEKELERVKMVKTKRTESRLARLKGEIPNKIKGNRN